MIIALETPPKIVLSGNPVVARLASDNYIVNAGTASVLIFHFTANENDGHTFAFQSVAAGSFEFTFKTSPDPNSPIDLPRKGAFSQAIWMQRIRQVLESNYYLDQHYIITDIEVMGDPCIRLMARKPGTDYDIEFLEMTVENLEIPISISGTGRTVRPNFRLLVETYTRDLVNFRLRGKGDLLAVDSNGVAIAQVNAYLEDRLENQFAWPIQAISPVGFRNQLASRSYLKWGESYGNPEQVYRMSRGGEFITLQGRIPRKRLVDFYHQYSNLLQYFQTTKRFLTWQPLVKPTFFDAPEKLYWLHFYEDVAQIKIRVKRVLMDGSSTIIDLTSLFTATPYVVVEIDTSASVIAASVANLAELHVWIARGDNTPLSAIQSYLIQPRPAVLHHYLFENPWGAYDCISFTGELFEEDEYTRDVEELYKPQLFAPPQRRFRNLRTNQKELFTAHSGFSESEEWILWVDDLFNAPAVYEAIQNELHEVVIEDGTIFKKRSNEFVRSVAMKYQRFAPEQIYRVATSEVLTLPPIIDPDEPVPQFPAGLVVGLAGADELLLPGNAWVMLPAPLPSNSEFVITAVMRIDEGEVALFTGATSSIVLSAAGNELIINSGANTTTVELEIDIRGKYLLLEFALDNEANFIVVANGQLIAQTSIAPIDALDINTFGQRTGDAANFVGRLADLVVGNADQLGNPEVVLAMAERLGIALPDVNWLQRYDDETRAFILENRLTRDDVTTGFIKMSRAPMPYFDPAPGEYVGPYPVRIRSESFGATVRFTDDGSEPTSASPEITFDEFVTVNGPKELKAVVFIDGFLPSPVLSGLFSWARTSSPQFEPEAGEHRSPLTLIGGSSTSGAVTYYTIDGSTPTEESPAFPEEGIVLTALPETVQEITLKAFSIAAGHFPSEIVTLVYEIDNVRSNDPDVRAFIDNGGFEDPVFISAYAEFVFELKQANLWDKIELAQIFYGTTAFQHGLNIKNPVNLESAHQLSFVGSWTFSNNGALNNGGHARTFLNLQTFFSLNDGISQGGIISGTPTTSNESFGGTNDFYISYRRFNGDARFIRPGGLITEGSSTTSFGGFAAQSVQKHASISPWNRLDFVGTLRSSDVTGVTNMQNLECFVGAYNDNSTPSFRLTSPIRFFFIGKYLTGSQLQTLRSLAIALNTAIR